MSRFVNGKDYGKGIIGALVKDFVLVVCQGQDVIVYKDDSPRVIEYARETEPNPMIASVIEYGTGLDLPLDELVSVHISFANIGAYDQKVKPRPPQIRYTTARDLDEFVQKLFMEPIGKEIMVIKISEKPVNIATHEPTKARIALLTPTKPHFTADAFRAAMTQLEAIEAQRGNNRQPVVAK